MNYKIISSENGWLKIGGIRDLSVWRTFDCGQCFRFDKTEDERFLCRFDGVARGKFVSFAEKGDGFLYVFSNEEDFRNIWADYLALELDYSDINRQITECLSGKNRMHMEKTIESSYGIRILRQDKWEALCSFIISQNNNIPRIKKIINALCREFGENHGDYYSFPTPEALALAGEEKIFELKTGFRAKYICDAANKTASGEIDLNKIANLKTYGEADEALCKIKGVGKKVSACTLLFGFSRLEAFPIDIWIKKVIENRFDESFSPELFGSYAGIAQQYLFYHERYIESKVSLSDLQ